ncbi:MAG: hypothetical protein Q8M76_14090 [Spirochaetaceae bacterium]|nr:hypothetical protein [Spirochaetaceae bacterium]
MKSEILAPALDANSASVTVENIRFLDCAKVEADAEVCDVSTPKASEVLLAPKAGYLVMLAGDGQEKAVGTPVALIYDTEDECRAAISSRIQAGSAPASVNATAKAKELAQRHGLDLSLIKKDGIIKEKDVQEYLDSLGGTK